MFVILGRERGIEVLFAYRLTVCNRKVLVQTNSGTEWRLRKVAGCFLEMNG